MFPLLSQFIKRARWYKLHDSEDDAISEHLYRFVLVVVVVVGALINVRQRPSNWFTSNSTAIEDTAKPRDRSLYIPSGWLRLWLLFFGFTNLYLRFCIYIYIYDSDVNDFPTTHDHLYAKLSQNCARCSVIEVSSSRRGGASEASRDWRRRVCCAAIGKYIYCI